MKTNSSRLFPRDVYGRIALGISSLFFVPVGALGAFMFLVGVQPRSLGERLIMAAAGNLLLAMALFFLCGFVWAVATPKWMESLLATVDRRLILAMLVFFVPFAIAAGWALVSGF